MTTPNRPQLLQKLKKDIVERVSIHALEEDMFDPTTGKTHVSGWSFDFRRIFLEGKALNAIAILFWDGHRNSYPFQIGGLEVAAIPLITGIQNYIAEQHPDASAFFIRKSRKKDGLMRMVEGSVKDHTPIVLVDDILNTGKSFIRQVEVLEELGHSVSEVWCILKFRDDSYYDYFYKKNIRVCSLFSLDDFSDELEVANIKDVEHEKPAMPFKVKWKFASKNPNYAYVVPKSDPSIDAKRVYFGSDSGVFRALNQEDGSTAWSYKVGLGARGKSIFSSPAVCDGIVYFGAYDGNLYALNAETGTKEWIFFEADWVGSSPVVAPDLGIVFVGLEFGLIKKRGAIVALNAKNGEKLWQYTMPMYTHASPLYIPERKQVAIGSNDGKVYLFDARSGDLIWSFETGAVTEQELLTGFSAHDIKESIVYDVKRDLLIFGNQTGKLFALKRKTGKEIFSFKAEFGFYSTPLVYGDSVFATSVDKHLYCIDLDSGKEKWRWYADARIFASPVCINGKLYVGANTGRITEIDPETGKELAFITVPERITNKVAYNPKTKRFFLPTFANEIYCLEREDG